VGCGNGGGEALLFEVQAPGLNLTGGARCLALLLQVEGELLVVPALLPLAVGIRTGALGLAVGFLLGEAAPALLLRGCRLAGSFGLVSLACETDRCRPRRLRASSRLFSPDSGCRGPPAVQHAGGS
jgi:hypothetical protein